MSRPRRAVSPISVCWLPTSGAGICCGIVAESTAQGFEQGIRYYSFEKPLRWNVAVSYPKGAFLNQAENLFIQQAREYWMQKAKVQSAEQK